MIIGFACKKTEQLYSGTFVKSFEAFQESAELKLKVLNETEHLNELRGFPSFRLETLKGDRKGQYSIRINKQWRICFIWTGEDADDVEIVDYH